MAYFKFANLIREGKPIDVYNHGKMARDFTYVDDVIESIIRLIPKAPKENQQTGNGIGDSNNNEYRNGDGDGTENGKGSGQNSSDMKHPSTGSSHYQLFNLGNGSPVNLLDFIKILEEQLGKSTKHNMMKMQPGDVVKTWADSSELHKHIDYKPKVNIREGITKFVDWYKSYYK